MNTDAFRKRLERNRTMTTVTIWIPEDVLQDLLIHLDSQSCGRDIAAGIHHHRFRTFAMCFLTSYSLSSFFVEYRQRIFSSHF